MLRLPVVGQALLWRARIVSCYTSLNPDALRDAMFAAAAIQCAPSLNLFYK
ncbi:hypothetical protein HMPREF0198_1238 [Cardiobacterium hominis ATCC 15826]|uniref:Uncharacterized protein n=1 Tax=Cardiobacterium hominis (strain ATCC 15826 / DSM 8339 / NCTC 10426 / 6573) TaxID=638300 RepID=C8N9R0_CARH6|nr:hypothetical protein HMPREF0198_1238 [Cardiobacterium hominis ATCC 15826]